MNVFETLNALNVNEHIEKKIQNGTTLSYLSWAWAWAETQKRYPDADYDIWRDPVTHLPYTYDPLTGYMVYTTVTIEGKTHMMWLPVMDGNNKAMKAEPYKYTTKKGEKTVEAATMFDVNKAIMRCLAKNLAMFGLGLYIYAGEDLPEGEEQKPEEPTTPQKPERWVEPVEPDKCECCGAEIADYTFRNGSKDKGWITRYSWVKYRKKMCGKCLEAYINEGN